MMETETEMELRLAEQNNTASSPPESFANRVADKLGVQVDTVWKLIHTGRIQININKHGEVEYISIGAI